MLLDSINSWGRFILQMIISSKLSGSGPLPCCNCGTRGGCLQSFWHHTFDHFPSHKSSQNQQNLIRISNHSLKRPVIANISKSMRMSSQNSFYYLKVLKRNNCNLQFFRNKAKESSYEVNTLSNLMYVSFTPTWQFLNERRCRVCDTWIGWRVGLAENQYAQILRLWGAKNGTSDTRNESQRPPL